ncbi:HEAT repeat domain-containing protein [Cronbergia sp. UHCC 0137]|uniref:HEAT repeat domain-containing protein n=1 Tax=Cronbergia sp. UHCC 0137 TaxID=3110239 RepID=UPI002B21429A|nr:HEAT repeat domain-containing protein [Cronbergia sp. UHCC 0137]MEA5619879.1 HEAT repeat domain-containing protein [Cronbergia sp. UHCC 0137]
MSRNIRGDESVLENVLSLVEALLQLSEEQECESKLPLCVVWNADKLRITGYKSAQTRGNRSKTPEVGTKKEYLLKQIKDAGKTLKLPPQKAQPSFSQDKRELDELQTALDWLKELGVREDQKSTKSQGYWKFTLTLKHQTATIKENLEVVKQKWKEHQKTNLKETSQVETTDNSLDWQEICGAMLEKHKRLTTNELLFADEEMKFDLEAIHVPLALVERTKPKKCREDISAEQGSQLYEPSYEEKQRFEHQAFLEKIIRDGVGKTQGQRIALIGEPGAGKTTQLQTIAFWILNNNLGLPIWISLADLQGKSVEEYLLQDWLKNALEVVRVKEEQENAFADLFKNNPVWLLLDAADEMSSLQPLTDISQQLTGWVKNARVVLTCRVNVWEANAGALENFETYRLLNFEYPKDVQEFIGRCFDKKNPDKGKRLWNELNKPESQRIQDLVKNPLRLALLCSTWQSSDKGLPKTKAELYQHFVEEFYKWKENRFHTTEQQQEELNAALGRLAKRAIDQETSRFRLRHKFVREVLGDPKQQNSLFWLALKLGWLNEVGLAAESATKEKVYAFYHPTFEEYFAALAIADWHEFLNHVPDNPAQGVYRIFAPQWKEVILLWLGRDNVGKEKKEEFIQALIEFDDGCGEYKDIDKVTKGFYEFCANFLAAAGISEFRDYSRVDQIVLQIIKWCFGYFNKSQEWIGLLEPIQAEAQLVLLQTERTKTIDGLVDLIADAYIDDDTKRSVVVSLGQIGSGSQAAINSLVNLINNPQVDPFTKGQTAFSLGQINPNNQIAINAFVELISNPQVDYAIRWQAAKCLGKIDPGNKTAITTLVKLISDSQVSDEFKWEISESLGKIDPGNETAITTLVKIIGNPHEVGYALQWEAAQSVKEISFTTGTQTAMIGLSKLICDSQIDDETKWLVADSLNQIDTGNKIAINALIQLINNPKVDVEIQLRAAFSLGQIDLGKQIAITALVNLIGNPKVDAYTQVGAAFGLGQIDIGNQMAITSLVNLIRNPKVNSFTRGQAAFSLGQIGFGSQIAITALVELTQNPHENVLTQVQAAFALGLIDPGNKIAIPALVQLLQLTDVHDYTHELAVESLEKIMLEEQMPSVVTVLKDYLSHETYKNDFKRFDYCYKVIWKCAQSMPYPAFYQALHQQEKVKDGE